MKIRTGFVSNSSSSSFICEVCGDTFESYDQGISDFGLVECDRDHLFCESHAVNLKPDGSYEYSETIGENKINSIHCPICQLKSITDLMALAYTSKRLGRKIADIKMDISEDFEDYDQFERYLAGDEDEFYIELTAHVKVKAGNKELAHMAAREMVMGAPVLLNVTYCESV
jgi:hypothetical protein